MFSISILLDTNWRYFKLLAGSLAPAKLLTILRCIQTTSIFALTLLVVNYTLKLYFPIDPSMATIIASTAGIVLAITIGITVYKGGKVKP